MRIFRLFSAPLVLGMVLVFLLATPLLQQAANAQATTTAGAIQGTVTDPQGAILPGATVTITSMATSAKKTLTTDSAGFYTLSSLVPGQYQIVVAEPGFSKTATTLTVQIGTTTNGDVKLKLGSASEEVTVTSEELEVNTAQSTVSGVLTAQQIDNLPISGRNFLDLSQLEPGVQLQSGENFDPTKAGYSSISFNGVNGRTARILLDGQDISDETVGTTTINVSQGSIEEFQMSRSSLDISNELTSSGAVAVSTKSGTNQFHGEGFDLFRDQRTGAADGPGGTDLPFQRDQMGGRLGGPILRDKLFIFGSAERVKQDSMNDVQVGAPFASNSGFYGAPFRDNYYVARSDYNAPKGIHLFARIAYEDNLDDATMNSGFSRYANKDNTPAIAGGADFMTGKFTHSLRWSYLKFHNMLIDASAGLPNLTPGVELWFNDQGLITGPNDNAPQQTYQSDKQVRYDAGYTIKSHVFNFGASFNRILNGGYASFFKYAPQAYMDFADGSTTGVSTDPTSYAAAFTYLGNGLGYNTEKSEFGMPAGGQSDWRMGVYFGDTWKLFQRLTVNYGIRYSRDTGRSDSDLAPVPCADAVTAWGASSPCATGNLLDALEPGLGDKVRQPNDDFGPKAGFAYDLKGDGKTVIRGGLGLYYENNIFNNVLFDRPARLKEGLFWNYQIFSQGASTFNPGTGAITSVTVNGVAKPISQIASKNEPISDSAPYLAELQSMYQAATLAAGPAGNFNYAANSLSEGTNGYAMYAPNFRTPRSIQINFGVQHEVWKGGIFSADYVRNVGEHIIQSIDKNHVGDATTLNPAAATTSINDTLAECNSPSIDAAIANCPGLYQPDPTKAGYHPSVGAIITDFATAHLNGAGTALIDGGLDSGNAGLAAGPAASYGLTPDGGAAFPGINPLFGQMRIAYPMGRAVYNGLQTNLRQSARVPLPGLKASNFEVSYTLSRMIGTGGADQSFTPQSVDNNNPLAYAGPAGTDRTHMLSYGGTFSWIYGITTDIIGHYYSALPSTLTLDNNHSQYGTAEIFSSDTTGDGTTGDLLPGYKSGAFMRSVKASDLPKVIANYNATAAGRLTPAGQALVSNGLFTEAELTALGAVTRTIAAPPQGNVGNSSLRTFDLTLTRAIKLRWLGNNTTIVPSFSAFNLFNFSNFNGNNGEVNNLVAGNLAASQQPGTANGTTASYDSANPFNRNAMRTGNGSGVFGVGSARVLEYGVKLSF